MHNLKNVVRLSEGNFYHIYNRGNNVDNLFYNPENYWYFLRKYDEYLSDYLETYAFCLLPNHFHLLVRVKDQIQPMKIRGEMRNEADVVISEIFRRMFMS
jgi:putative transposase